MFESLKRKIGALFGKAEPKKADKKAKNASKAKKKTEKKKPKKAEKKATTFRKSSRSQKGEKKGKKKLLESGNGTKQLPVPKKFNAGLRRYEPDFDKVKEKAEEFEENEDVEEKKGFFSRLVSKISSSELTAKDFEEMFFDFEIVLLENNVALEVVDKIKKDLCGDLVGKRFGKKEAAGKVLGSLKNSVLDVLIEPPNLIEEIKKKEGVYVILFFGINGSGKTTSVAKLASKLKKKGISCVFAAADTFRAASIEQLKKHGENLDIKVISHDYGSDPASVAFDARQYAEKNGVKVVLVDTAGRMYTKSDLLREMEKIVRVSKPDLKIFVGESITGNDATEQARTFNESIGFDGIVLSKADIDDKAGTILSVSYVTGKPIYYLGVGQGYGDLKEFSKEEVLKNLGLE